ncbi:hypothetical protein QQ045_004338 [Rhodiola kirilowii]
MGASAVPPPRPRAGKGDEGKGFSSALAAGPSTAPPTVGEKLNQVELEEGEVAAVASKQMAKTEGVSARPRDFREQAKEFWQIYASNEIKRDVCIKGPRGTNFIQKVEYEWLPQRCSHCQSFGHTVNRCPFPQLRVEGEGEVNERVIIETNGVEDGVILNGKSQGLKKAKQNDGNLQSEGLVLCDLSQEAGVPETLQCEPGGRGDDIHSANSLGPGCSSSGKAMQGVVGDSVDSIETIASDEVFTEVKRKVKNKKKNKGNGNVAAVPIGLGKWTQRSTGKGALPTRF